LKPDHVSLKRGLPLSSVVVVVTFLRPLMLAFQKTCFCASHLRDFLGDVSSLARVSSNLSSISTVHFMSGLLASSSPVVFSLLTMLCVLCLVGSGCPGNGHRNFLRHFPADSYLKYSCSKTILLSSTAEVTKHCCVIRCSVCLPRFPDLPHCDYYLCGNLNDKACRTNPHTLDELKNICW
jgi:hypothetical protein